MAKSRRLIDVLNNQDLPNGSSATPAQRATLKVFEEHPEVPARKHRDVGFAAEVNSVCTDSGRSLVVWPTWSAYNDSNISLLVTHILRSIFQIINVSACCGICMLRHHTHECFI